MVDVDTLLTDVARYLSDFDSTRPEHQHVTWSRSDLVAYLRYSLAALASVREDDFSKRIEIPLDGTDLVSLPSECDKLLSVIGHRRPDGTIDTSVRTKSDIKAINRPICKTRADGTEPVEVDLLSAGARDIVVSPSTARGALVVRCQVFDSIEIGAVLQIPAARAAVLFNWMISYAMGTETESTGLRGRSDEHWKRGADLLGLSPYQRRAARSGT